MRQQWWIHKTGMHSSQETASTICVCTKQEQLDAFSAGSDCIKVFDAAQATRWAGKRNEKYILVVSLLVIRFMHQ